MELIRLHEEVERKEQESLAELERQRRERLLGYARDHRAAENMRAFMAIVGAKAEAQATVTEWLNWGRAVADRLDPLATMALLAGESADPLRQGDWQRTIAPDLTTGTGSKQMQALAAIGGP